MKLTIFICLIIVNCVLCGNVLFISPVPSPSHHLWNTILSKGLIEKGHNITMLSYDTQKKPIVNFTVITMPGMYENLPKYFKMEEAMEDLTIYTIMQMFDFGRFLCDYAFKSDGLEKLLNYPKDFKFDLIIYDVTTGQCFYPLVEIFNNPPVVAVTAFLLPSYLSDSFGNHLYPSYVPFYGTEFTSSMTLFQRVINFLYTNLEVFTRKYLATSAEFSMAKERFGEYIRPLHEVERNISLLLTNIDPVLNYPLALPPNIIPVGGLHARPPQTLPKDLETIVNSAKNGVILFSLGTNIKSSDLNPKIQQEFLKAFSKLPQTILWKFEADHLEGLPENVVIRKWLPQNDILGHPNTKLFLSHGGALSTQEAMYHGVPVVGIPFFADQYVNIRQMREKGIAEHIDIRENPTADEIVDKIQEVLNCDSYKTKISKIARLYKDQPLTALEKAVFWIEYVMRHGTAEHLVLPARDMPGYQTANLDVLAIFAMTLVLVYLLFKMIIGKCRYSTRRKSEKIKVS